MKGLPSSSSALWVSFPYPNKRLKQQAQPKHQQSRSTPMHRTQQHPTSNAKTASTSKMRSAVVNALYTVQWIAPKYAKLLVGRATASSFAARSKVHCGGTATRTGVSGFGAWRLTRSCNFHPTTDL